MRGLLLVVVLAGCIRDDLVACADGRLCPVGTACDDVHRRCVAPDQFDACRGADPLAACRAPSIGDGRCFDGVCLPAGCGNGLHEPDSELCDDGNTVSDDGCSADCRSQERCGDGFADVARGEACDDGNFINRDGCTARCTQEELQWRVHSSIAGGRRGIATAYDALRGVLVTFGGVEQNGDLINEMLEWNGRVWTGIIPEQSPPRRANAAIAYDPIRHTTLLFGGFGPSGFFNDTWEWNGATWKRMQPLLIPLARSRHAMAWDPISQRIIMFGGNVGIAALDDTWAWTGTEWTPVIGSRADQRLGHTLVHDPVRNRLVLVGGRSASVPSEPAQTTWVFDGTSWSQLAATWPGGLATAAAFDPTAGRIIARAGDATWALDGATWSQLSTTPGVVIDGDFTMTNAPLTQRPMLFGDRDVAAVWIWDGTAWTLDAPAPEPPGGVGAASASDPVRGRVVMFGGAATNTLYSDTWEWDGSGWTRVTPSTPASPSQRWQAAMAYDGVRGEVLLFGGEAPDDVRLGDAWTWNGTRWAQLPAGPPARSGAAIAYDPKRRRIVMFGGADTETTVLRDTWEWDGAAWTLLQPAGPTPPARTNAAMAYDAARERLVLIGGGVGSSALDDIWEWDGVAWTERNMLPRPEPRTTHVAVYDRVRRRMLVAAGFIPDFAVWEGDGASWRQPTTLVEPIAMLGPAAAYDDRRRELVLFGGAFFIDPTVEPPLVEFLGVTWTASYRGDTDERCELTIDHDGDGATGCDDADCALACEPACLLDGGCD